MLVILYVTHNNNTGWPSFNNNTAALLCCSTKGCTNPFVNDLH